MYDYEITGKLEIFKMKGGWHYVRVPRDISDQLLFRGIKGMIPIEANVGNSKWNTSLMSMGDKNYFVAIKSLVRKDENIHLGDTVKIGLNIR